MTTPSSLLQEMRRAARLSQRALAQRAETSQSAVARYEQGAATPSWGTLQRLATACGQSLRLSAEPVPDPDDVALAETLLELTPGERLRSLRHYARLHGMASVS